MGECNFFGVEAWVRNVIKIGAPRWSSGSASGTCRNRRTRKKRESNAGHEPLDRVWPFRVPIRHIM